MPSLSRSALLAPRTLAVLGMGGIEIAVRLAPGLVVRIVDATLGAVLVSITVNTTIDNSVLLGVSQTLFLVAVFYSFVSSVYPRAAGERAERDHRIYGVLAICSGLFALPIVLVTTGAAGEIPGGFPVNLYLAAAFLISLGSVWLLLHWTQSERLTAMDAPASDVWRSGRDATTIESVKNLESATRSHPFIPTRRLAQVLVTLSVVSSYVIPVVMLGVVGAAINGVFPLLEILVVIGLIHKISESNESAILRWTHSVGPNIESVLYNHLTMATQGGPSAILTSLIVLSIIYLIGAFMTALQIGTFDLRPPILFWQLTADFAWRWLTGTVQLETVGETFLNAVAETGFVVTVPVTIGYSVWFWYRELQRLPWLYPEKDAARRLRGTYDTPPVRVPGMLLPGALMAVAWKIFEVVQSNAAEAILNPSLARLLLAVAWPSCIGMLVLTGWTAVRTGHSERTPESHATVPALFLAFLSSLVIGNVVIMPLAQALVRATVLTGVFVWFYYLQPAIEWAETGGGTTTWRLCGYGLLLSIILVPPVVSGHVPSRLLFLLAVPLILLFTNWLEA